MNILFLLFVMLFANSSEELIVDSDMSFEEAIKGTKAPQEIIDSISLIDVYYYSFDDKLHKGQLLVHSTCKNEVIEIFQIIREIKFPVQKAIPIVQYTWSDNKSMQANNSSSFNYRFVANTNRLSLHAYGKAVDINPFQNPVVYADGKISPKGAKYDPKKPGTLRADSRIVKEFEKRGWRWGGKFTSFKDYHHFDKD
ncbi:MAG: M15 family metallopeptidase [Ignavibacteria bacterium]|nr:M15 family metallopeptidase [Ignavibacteria bacterium]